MFLRAIRLEAAKVPKPKAYPFTIPALKKFKRMEFPAPVTFLIGENGMGKSTLMEAIAVRSKFNAEGGSKNFNFATTRTHSSFSSALTLEWEPRKPTDGYFFRAESFYTLASELENLDMIPSNSPPILAAYGRKSLHAQSHGEAFLSLILKRLRGNGLYIFDEPEAALSPSRQLAVLVAIDQLVKKGSQFIIATHSPILMAYPGAVIYQLTPAGIESVAYTDTEHFTITKSFLNKHEQMISRLFNPTA